MRKTLLPGLAALALAGCGMNGTTQVAPPPPSLAASMTEADTLIRGGQRDKAIGLLQQAAATHPTDVAPVLRLAQMHYDRNEYGPAITWAHKALGREPSNLLANSIVAVSGLRVASKSLTDLSERNNLSGSVRNEAEELAKLLRTSLGEEVLVPVRGGPVKSKSAAAARNDKKVKKDASDDPFGALK